MDENELNADEAIEAAEQWVNAPNDFAAAAAAFVEAVKPLVETMTKIAQDICALVVQLMPVILAVWNYIQTHWQLDARFVPTPISIALAEIYAPNAPPKFFALN